MFGNEAALALARQYEYREFWDLFYQDADPFSKRPVAGLYSEYCHAYSHVNSFNSCAKAYEQTRDPYYLKALRSFYRFMQAEEVMATGGYGANFEHLMPKTRLIDALRTGHDSFETQCDSYAAYRLVKYLTCLTDGAEFGNWAEALIYNATVATLPMTAAGNTLYYSDYNMYGGQKQNRADGWTCCTGTRPLLGAAYTGLQTPNDHCDIRALVPKMRTVSQKPLHYTVEGMASLTFKPFYEFAEHEPYFIYHDTTAHATRFNNAVE